MISRIRFAVLLSAVLGQVSYSQTESVTTPAPFSPTDLQINQATEVGCMPDSYRRVLYLPVSEDLNQANNFFAEIERAVSSDQGMTMSPELRERDLLVLLDEGSQYQTTINSSLSFLNKKIGICGLGRYQIEFEEPGTEAPLSLQEYRLNQTSDQRASIQITTSHPYLRDAIKIDGSNLHLHNLVINGNGFASFGSLIASTRGSQLQMQRIKLTRKRVGGISGPEISTVLYADNGAPAGTTREVLENEYKNRIILDDFSEIVHDMPGTESGTAVSLNGIAELEIRGYSQMLNYQGTGVDLDCGDLIVNRGVLASIGGTMVRGLHGPDQPFGSQITIDNSWLLSAGGNMFRTTRSTINISNTVVRGCANSGGMKPSSPEGITSESQLCDFANRTREDITFFNSPAEVNWFDSTVNVHKPEQDPSFNIINLTGVSFVDQIVVGLKMRNQDEITDGGNNQWLASGTPCLGSVVRGGINFANGVPCLLGQSPTFETTTLELATTTEEMTEATTDNSEMYITYNNEAQLKQQALAQVIEESVEDGNESNSSSSVKSMGMLMISLFAFLMKYI